MYNKVHPLYISDYPLFFRFFSHIAITEYWVEFPVLHSRFLLIICFIYSSVYMSIPISQFVPSCISLLVIICLFSTSVTLFLFYKFVSSFFFRFHIQVISRICLSDLLHSVWQSLGPFMLLQMALFNFNGWVIFCCIYVQHLLYPFLCWWTLGCFTSRLL